MTITVMISVTGVPGLDFIDYELVDELYSSDSIYVMEIALSVERSDKFIVYPDGRLMIVQDGVVEYIESEHDPTVLVVE
jgi:hypothetical protein